MSQRSPVQRSAAQSAGNVWPTPMVVADWRNKRIVMNVASVRFRAEIFVNKKLVGYDLVNSNVLPYPGHQ